MLGDRRRLRPETSFTQFPDGEVLRTQNGEPTVIRAGGVVHKRARHYDPRDSRPSPKTAWALFNEWAALEWLDQLKVRPRVSPSFIAGDSVTGMLTIEDLGDTPSLADVLAGDDSTVARKACIEHSRALARLHRATLGRQEEYYAIRDALAPGGRRPLYECEKEVEHFRRACSAVGVDLRGAESDIRSVIVGMEHPAAGFVGLLHGDVGPGNEKLVDGHMVLIDFEIAGFGHIFREAVAARLVFSEGSNDAALPGELVEEMERAYRAELALPKGDWLREYAISAAYHVMTEIGLELAKGAIGWRVAFRCRAFIEVVEETGHLSGLRMSLRNLVASMPHSPAPPTYPAFR